MTGAAVGRDHEVRGLDVAVDEPAGVRGAEAVEHLEEVPRGVGDAERAAAPALDELVEALALDVLHDHEMDVPLAADLEGPRQVGVLDAPGEVHLAAEPVQRLLLLERLLGGEHLDRDATAVGLVDGEEDLAHPPFAERPEDAVSAQDEALGRPREHLAGLVRGQRPRLHQLPGQADRRIRGGLGVEVGQGARHDQRVDQAAPGEVRHEIVEPWRPRAPRVVRVLPHRSLTRQTAHSRWRGASSVGTGRPADRDLTAASRPTTRRRDPPPPRG